MKVITLIISLSLVLLIPVALCQTDDGTEILPQQKHDQAQRERLETLQKQLEGMQEMMNKNMRKNFEEMDQMMKQFEKGFQDDFFEDDFFQGDSSLQKRLNQLLHGFGNIEFDRDRDYKWKETPKERILELKFVPVKDSPVDIKVTKDKITIKGKSESKQKTIVNGKVQELISIINFDKSLSVPADVDGNKAIIEEMKGGIRIRLPKKHVMSKDLKKPLKPSKDDQTI